MRCTCALPVCQGDVVRLLGALDVETHEARAHTHAAHARCTRVLTLLCAQAVAETLVSQLISCGAIKPVEVAERDSATGA
jgi:hypothetical protein